MAKLFLNEKGFDVSTIPQVKNNSLIPIVGIAASAGGIDAFKQLISHIPVNSGMSFVLIVHHDICHISNLPNLIKKYSDMPISCIENAMRAEPNNIYVLPPNKNATIEYDIFYLTEKEKSHHEDLPMNVFFKSLAKDKGRNAAAVILSGFGTFGTSNLGMIKNEGGIVIAQDPLSAKYAGMPKSAINTGFVDYILPIENIPTQLIRYFHDIEFKDRKISRHLKCLEKIKLNRKQDGEEVALDKALYQLVNELNSYQIEIELQNEDLIKSQLELEESRNKYVDLYDFAPVGYFTFDQNGLIAEVNQMGADLLGVKKHALINRSFSRYIAPDSQNAFYHHRQLALKKMCLQIDELKLLKRNEPIFYAQINSKAIINPTTGHKQILSFISDITHNKQAEDLSHQHQQKIASLDRVNSLNELASSIAHELNHPLAVVTNFMHGCIRRLKSGKFDVNEIIKVMEQATLQSQRAAEIILRMKNFTCKGKLHYELVCINTVINDAVSLIHHELSGFPIKIHFRTTKHLPLIKIDKIHIEQVIINLIRNAIEAMRDAHIDEPKLVIESNLVSINKIEISIIDNGPGIETETTHNLFNPHFSTKPYGVGLGLAVSRTIIEAHGGELSVEANVTYGACFKFTLPISISP